MSSISAYNAMGIADGVAEWKLAKVDPSVFSDCF